MFFVLKFPPALRQIFDDKTETAFIDFLNRIDFAKRFGYALSREAHLQALGELIARHFEASKEENKPALQEAKAWLNQMIEEYRLDNRQRLAEAETNSMPTSPRISPALPGFFDEEPLQDKWFREMLEWVDERFDELANRLEELHAALVKYLFINTWLYLSQRQPAQSSALW